MIRTILRVLVLLLTILAGISAGQGDVAPTILFFVLWMGCIMALGE